MKNTALEILSGLSALALAGALLLPGLAAAQDPAAVLFQNALLLSGPAPTGPGIPAPGAALGPPAATTVPQPAQAPCPFCFTFSPLDPGMSNH